MTEIAVRKSEDEPCCASSNLSFSASHCAYGK